jgi:hypothetical protein
MKVLQIIPLINFLLLLSQLVGAQSSSDDEKGFEFGLNVGVYRPSKYSANYYNGSPGNLNNTTWVMTNRVFYDTIYYRMNAIDTVFVDEGGWPTNMHYKITIMPGIYGQYTFNKEYALFFEFNYMKLTTQDALVFRIPKPYASFPDQRLCPIRGVEERFYIDIGIKRSYELTEKTSLHLIAGLNLNNTKVIKSVFFVDEREFSIVNNYINGIYVGPNSQTFNLNQGGLGWGLYLSGGLTLHFGEIAFEPGINFHFVNVNLDGFEKYRPGFGLNARFSLNNFLFASE